MSVLFIIGSVCFGGAAAAFLLPSANHVRLNWVFFTGSIIFTVAGYLQLRHATNQKGQISRFFAWRPQNVGYPAALTQWIGALFFNINTFDATLTDFSWIEGDLYIWTPNVIGSVLFLVSACYLLQETTFRFAISDLDSCGAWINLLGCIAFMISALCSVDLPWQVSESVTRLALITIALGALCFLIVSVLTLLRMGSDQMSP